MYITSLLELTIKGKCTIKEWNKRAGITGNKDKDDDSEIQVNVCMIQEWNKRAEITGNKDENDDSEVRVNA